MNLVFWWLLWVTKIFFPLRYNRVFRTLLWISFQPWTFHNLTTQFAISHLFSASRIQVYKKLAPFQSGKLILVLNTKKGLYFRFYHPPIKNPFFWRIAHLSIKQLSKDTSQHNSKIARSHMNRTIVLHHQYIMLNLHPISLSHTIKAPKSGLRLPSILKLWWCSLNAHLLFFIR